MTMAKCTRIGCGKSFDPSANDAADCNFHPGAPLFHEGLKSYASLSYHAPRQAKVDAVSGQTCCKDTNRPVLTFDEFLAIPGCTTGSHSSEKSEVKMPVVTANVQNKAEAVTTSNGEATAPVVAAGASQHLTAGPTTYKSRPVSPNGAAASPTASSSSATLVEEQDPLNAVIPASSKCKRLGCGNTYDASAARTEEECTYHPLPAIFHEGSKGYACCKRRVLEFDEFLRIEGCRKGKHLFVGAPKEGDELVHCRSDMYQTPTQVICSVFGKGADKDRSAIRFDEWEMHVDLFLPSSKRFTKTFALYGPIDADKSTFRIMGTKVEMTLVKADGRSWPALETGGKDTSQITFGVQGRTGSVGAKEMIYRGDVVH